MDDKPTKEQAAIDIALLKVAEAEAHLMWVINALYPLGTRVVVSWSGEEGTVCASCNHKEFLGVEINGVSYIEAARELRKVATDG